jgi:hypothetical protein
VDFSKWLPHRFLNNNFIQFKLLHCSLKLFHVANFKEQFIMALKIQDGWVFDVNFELFNVLFSSNSTWRKSKKLLKISWKEILTKKWSAIYAELDFQLNAEKRTRKCWKLTEKFSKNYISDSFLWFLAPFLICKNIWFLNKYRNQLTVHNKSKLTEVFSKNWFGRQLCFFKIKF